MSQSGFGSLVTSNACAESVQLRSYCLLICHLICTILSAPYLVVRHSLEPVVNPFPQSNFATSHQLGFLSQLLMTLICESTIENLYTQILLKILFLNILAPPGSWCVSVYKTSSILLGNYLFSPLHSPSIPSKCCSKRIS